MAEVTDIEFARQFAERLRRDLGRNLTRVSLFGSRARRDHEADSDFDLMIVLQEPSGDARSKIHASALSMEMDHYVDLSTKILSVADFSRLRASADPFWREFERDERVLWPTH